MDLFSWPILELLIEQSVRERYLGLGRRQPARHEQPGRRSGIKSALASILVRLGLCLDPTVGERLRAPHHSPIAPEVRQQA